MAHSRIDRLPFDGDRYVSNISAAAQPYIACVSFAILRESFDSFDIVTGIDEIIT